MDGPELMAEVGRIGRLGTLSDQLRAALLEGAHLVEYPSGSVTFRNHDRDLALVISGLVRIYLAAPDGRQITVRYVGAGGLVHATGRPLTNVVSGAQAVEPSRAMVSSMVSAYGSGTSQAGTIHGPAAQPPR